MENQDTAEPSSARLEDATAKLAFINGIIYSISQAKEYIPDEGQVADVLATLSSIAQDYVRTTRLLQQ